MLATSIVYIPLLVLLGSLSTLLLTNGKQQTAKLYFAVFGYLMTSWILFCFLTDISNDQSLKLTYLRLALLAGTLATYLFPLFCIKYAKQKIHISFAVTWSLIILPLVVFGFSDAMVSGVEYVWGAQPSEAGVLYSLQSLLTVISLGGGTIWLLRATRKDATLQNKVRFILYGLALSLAINFVTGFILFLLGARENSGIVGPASVIFFVASIYYALSRYRIFDVRPHIVRLFTFVLSVSLLASSYAMLNRLVEHFISGPGREIISAAVLTVTIVLYRPLYDKFTRLTNRFLHQGSYEPTVEINRLLEKVVTAHSFEQLSNIVTQQLQTIIGLEFARILEGSDTSSDVQNYRLSDSNSYLVLGPKLNGSSYNKSDQALIQATVHNTAIMRENLLYLENIKQFNKRLEEEIEDATTQLRSSNKKLRDTSKAKDEIVSMATHQIWPQLTAVRGFIEMTLGRTSGKDRESLHWALSGMARIAQIISDMLSLSRFSLGQLELNISEVDLTAVVNHEIEAAKYFAETSNITFKVLYKQKAHMVQGDKAKLGEVVTILIHNAIQYSHKNTVVEIDIQQSESSCAVFVRDHGIGVPTQEAKHLFEQFYRGKEAKNLRLAGSGIGLFLLKVIIEKHKGRVFYEQPLDNKGGSVFGFSLPA